MVQNTKNQELKSQQQATHLYSKNDQMRVLGHQGSFSWYIFFKSI